MEAFNNFIAKLKNAYKSGTIRFGAFILALGGTAKALELAQSDLLPRITPYINPTFAMWLSAAVTAGIWYYRFKTVASLADK